MGEQAKLVLKKVRENKAKDRTPERKPASLPNEVQEALALVREAKRRAVAKKVKNLSGSMGNQRLIEQLQQFPEGSQITKISRPKKK